MPADGVFGGGCTRWTADVLNKLLVVLDCPSPLSPMKLIMRLSAWGSPIRDKDLSMWNPLSHAGTLVALALTFDSIFSRL